MKKLILALILTGCGSSGTPLTSNVVVPGSAYKLYQTIPTRTELSLSNANFCPGFVPYASYFEFLGSLKIYQNVEDDTLYHGALTFTPTANFLDLYGEDANGVEQTLDMDPSPMRQENIEEGDGQFVYKMNYTSTTGEIVEATVILQLSGEALTDVAFTPYNFVEGDFSVELKTDSGNCNYTGSVKLEGNKGL